MSTPSDDINLAERSFLRQWTATDFSSWNEQTVREEFIIRLLHLLGYRKGTSHDLEMEKELQLGEPYHRIGRKKVAIDYAPSLRLRHFWIVEAKPGSERPMKFGDVLQVHLYAIHPEVQARLIVLCNGWEVRIYDALTLRSFDDTLHVCTRDDCFRTFAQLRSILSAEAALTFQRRRLLDLAKDTLDVEVDIERFRDFSVEMEKILRSGAAKVNENARRLRMEHFNEGMSAERDELRTVSIDVLFVKMDLPEDARVLAPYEFCRRVAEAEQDQRQQLIEKLAMRYRARPHNIFRGLAVHALVRLLELGITINKSPYVSSIADCISELARANIVYWSGMSNALCHLDNAAMRVAYKFCTRIAMNFMKDLLDEGNRVMTTEDRIRKNISVADLMILSTAHMQEILWRKFCSLPSTDEIWAGIWTLQAVEKELDQLPDAVYPDGNSDLLFWEHQGLSFDQLRVLTWAALTRKVPFLRNAGVAEDVLDFASTDRQVVLDHTPQAATAPSDFMPAWATVDLIRDVLPKVLALRVSAVMTNAAKQSM